MTYNKTEREHVGRLAQRTFSVRFRTSPHPIAQLSTSESALRPNVGGVFEVDKLDLLRLRSLVGLLHIEKYIGRLHICYRSVFRGALSGMLASHTCVHYVKGMKSLYAFENTLQDVLPLRGWRVTLSEV